ncbi:MAG: UDP-glucose 4-epimerase GalE [Bdellovibrionales bacterium RIFOXYD1_FULL_53_11]|nr:MAG: UDP-glucose 4-epimerase GalE [Bdellovibrionales bacterium RIFOXYD1_FULL_53_11]
MAKVLIVGGAGYVGSATNAWLLDKGHETRVVDNLSTGHRELVLGGGATFCNAGDADALTGLLSAERFDCVMHFAALSLVSESFALRDEYFENNVEQTRILVKTMLACGIRRIIFSSTCSIFGDPGDKPINEALPTRPINPYGETKLAVEQILAEEARSRGLQAVALRYFNAAGAEPKLRVGEWHDPETHLVPRVARAALTDGTVDIYGADYPTPDGTCIRDYVHVSDLAGAHEAAMLRLMDNSKTPAYSGGRFEAFNLGSENGYSVRQIVDGCSRVSGKKINIIEKSRRPGDPSRLVADSRLARRELAFAPAQDSLSRIITSAFEWEKKLLQPRRAVFLDRDGTINEDPGYIGDPEKLKLLPGVGEALASLKTAGFALVVVSNQSGIARGLIGPEDLARVNIRLDELLRPFGVKIDRYEICRHGPDEGCECRKPKPKLVLDAARAMNIDLGASFMIGDKESDIQAGRAAGCGAVAHVLTGEGAKMAERMRAGRTAGPDFTGDDLAAAVRWIRDRASPGK